MSISFTAFAFEKPDNSFYVVLNTSTIGQCKVYIPYNYAKYFSTSNEGKSIVNTTSSAVTCYATDSDNVVYQVRFPSFGDPEYRLYENGYSYVKLYPYSISESNMSFLSDSDFGIFNHTATVNMASLLLIGVIVILCIMRL